MSGEKALDIFLIYFDMQQINIPTYGKIKLNSFRPLCMTQLGINAIEKFNFPPFIDSSCRREPDFQNCFPSISALCRKSKFAPKLQKDDIIIYMTVGRQILPYKLGHHLVAILQVEEIYSSHQIGYDEYLSKNLTIPSNCIVENNFPYEFNKTAGNFNSKKELNIFLKKTELEQMQEGNKRLVDWDKFYFERSKDVGCFIKTKSLYKNIVDPKIILPSVFESVFNKIPGTQNPRELTEKEFNDLTKLVGLDIQLGKKKTSP